MLFAVFAADCLYAYVIIPIKLDVTAAAVDLDAMIHAALCLCSTYAVGWALKTIQFYLPMH